MRNLLGKCPLALLSIAFLTTASNAQVKIQIQVQPAQNIVQAKRLIAPGGRANNFYLLTNAMVIKDIKFSKEQTAKFEKAQKAKNEATQEVYKKLRDRTLPIQQRRDLSKKLTEFNQNFTKEVEKILSKEQKKRLEQIQFQMTTQNGLSRIFYFQKYAKDLNITNEQKTEARRLQSEMSKAMRSIPKEVKGEERLQQRQNMMKATNKKIEELLTEAQRKKIADLRGKPFKGLKVNNRPIIRPLPVQPRPGLLPARPIKGKPVQPVKPKPGTPVKD